MPQSMQSKYGMAFVSLVILVILGMQLAVGFTKKRSAWPFIPYGMYKSVRVDGQRLDHAVHIYGVFADGSRVSISRDDVVLSDWVYRNNIELAIRVGKVSTLRPAAEWLCQQSQSPLVSLAYEDLGVAISKDGPVYGLPPELQASIDVSCP